MSLPIIKTKRLKGSNGKNWPGLVYLDPDARQPAAVLAQEIWESLHKLNPVNLFRVRLSKSAQRDMEYAGHEAEVQAAVLIYGDDEAPRRMREAEAMHKGYDGLFKRLTVDQIAREMADHADDARRFVRKHRETLERYK